jgi:imidazolonepropionase
VRTLLVHAAQLLTLAGPDRARRGAEMEDLGLIRDGAVLIENGRILAAGPTDAVARDALAKRSVARTHATKGPRDARVAQGPDGIRNDLRPAAGSTDAAPPGSDALEELDCRGQLLTPGLVDSHTHLVFPAPRLDDFDRRLRGATYEEIARSGGGILQTARQFAAAADADLLATAVAHLRAAQSFGATLVEIKSGYGLSPAAELRLLRLAAAAGRAAGVETVLTLLAAHVVPPEFAGKRAEFLRLINEVLLPAALSPAETAARGGQPIAFADVFCDRGAFTVSEADTVLRAARARGLGLKIHAEQLAATGAVRLAAEFGAASADHLEQTTALDHQALARSGAVATLLPGCDLFLATPYPPARALIAAGAAVALATDFNPGTSPLLSLPLAMSLACTQMLLTPAEAWTAVTINAAAALGRAADTGSLRPGKRADLALFAADDYRAIPYSLGRNLCRAVFSAGRFIPAPAAQGAAPAPSPTTASLP